MTLALEVNTFIVQYSIKSKKKNKFIIENNFLKCNYFDNILIFSTELYQLKKKEVRTDTNKISKV